MRPNLYPLLLALALALPAPLVLADHEHGGHDAAAAPAKLDRLSPAGGADCCPSEGAGQRPGPGDKAMDGEKCRGKGDCKNEGKGEGKCAGHHAAPEERELLVRLRQLERRLDLMQAVLEDLLARQPEGRCQCGGGGKHGGH